MLSISLFAQRQYTIHGTAPDKYNGSHVYLGKMDVYKPVTTKTVYTDSTYVEKGQFLFKGDLPADTSLYMIVLSNNSGLFVLDSEPLHATYVESNPSGYFQIDGSALNNDLSRIIEFPYKFASEFLARSKKRTELLANNEWTLADEDAAKEKEKKRAVDHMDYINKFVKDNSTNAAGQYMYILYGPVIKKEIKAKIESRVNEDTKQKIAAARSSINEMMKGLQATTADKERIKTGDKYVDFEGEILSGEKIKLSSVVGSKKLVLLDFWASWCVPCLKEMPEIIDLYNEHKGKGLQIVGISLDTNREKWRNAVEALGMQWVQCIDSNLSDPIAVRYGASAIPHTVLIDEHGDIVAVGLRGEELRKKIEELL